MQALITPQDGMRALERLLASAKHDLCLSMDHLDPDTPLLSPDLLEAGMAHWGDLISDASMRGVRIRVLLADHDPLFASDAHRRAWRQASALSEFVGEGGQILCAPHGQGAGWFWQLRMRRAIHAAQDRLRAENPELLTPLQRRALQARPVMRTARLHQGFAIADQVGSLIGGPRLASQSASVSVLLHDADFAGALHAHFADCWNEACAEATGTLARQAVPLDLSRRRQAPAGLRLLRSFATPRSGFARLGPEPAVCDHEAAFLRLIREASHSIHIQTGALTHGPLIEALVAAGQQKPDLHLVLMLPVTPESPFHEGQAQAAQWQAVTQLRAEFGARMAVLTSPEGQVGGLMLVDGRVAVLGSANFSARSMAWDSEASAEIRDPGFTQALRTALATRYGVAGDPATANAWREAAQTGKGNLHLYPEMLNAPVASGPSDLPAQTRPSLGAASLADGPIPPEPAQWRE